MSVMYKTVARAEPGVVGGGQTKFYPAIVRGRPIKLRKFATDITRTSRLATSDVYGVLEAFLDNLYAYLEEGRIVQLGDFGTFTPSINSQGVTDPTQVNQSAILRYKINFRPGPFLRKRLGEVDFEKITNESGEIEIDN